MVDILVITTLHKPNILWFNKLYSQKYSLGKLDFLQLYTGYPSYDNIGASNIAEKLNHARSMYLSGNYDYMVLIEDDNILSFPNDLERLVQSTIDNNADVMYSPYVFRNAGNMSSCVISINKDKGYYYTAEKFPEHYTAWLKNGSIIECDGAGFGFTVISNHVVERIPFRVQNEYEQENWEYPCHPDITFMVDCVEQGFRCLTNFSLLNGHIHYDKTDALLLTPNPYRDDFVSKKIIQVS
jgi:hypothetical protein